MLTQQQVTQWETFGFLHLRGVLNADELEVINAEYEKGLNRTRDQTDSPVGNRRQLNWPNMGPDTPFLAGLLEDPRICGVAEQLFGDDVVGVASNGNHFAGDRTEWHPDTHDPHMQGVKFACYLQPLGAESGALRVIPGSHKSPLHDDLFRVPRKDSNRRAEEQTGLSVSEFPAHVCSSEPGDLIAFNFRLWHASWGGTSDRRMCSIMYYNNPKTPEEETANREMVAIVRRVHEGLEWKEPQHSPYWLSNPHKSTKRQRWIEWLRRWEFVDAD